MVRERLPPEERKSQILQAAFDIAVERGAHRVTRGEVAGRCSCATSLVTHYYGSTGSLVSKVMERAVATNVWSIIASGIVLDHPVTRNLPAAIRQQAMQEGVPR